MQLVKKENSSKISPKVCMKKFKTDPNGKIDVVYTRFFVDLC